MVASRIATLLVFLSLGLAAGPARADIAFPSGIEDFEAFPVGTPASGIPDWVVVNDTPGTATFTVANDVLGVVTPRGASTHWLRVDDAEAGNVQNRFYSGVVIADVDPLSYQWVFYVLHEMTPPGGAAVKPKLTIQHIDTPGFTNSWGIEFTDLGANLIVLGNGGPPASTPLYSLGSPTGIGDWIRLELHVDFVGNEVSANVNGGAFVSLPIGLPGTADKKIQRFCYRGEGTDNVNRMLIDDIEVAVTTPPAVPAVSTWGLMVMLLVGLVAMTLMRRRFPSIGVA